MSNVVNVPMQFKTNGFHKGHLAVLDYAKNFGTPEVIVLPTTMDVLRYMRGQINTLDVPKTLKTMGQDVSRLKLKMRIREYPTISLKERAERLEQANRIILRFKDSLPIGWYGADTHAKLETSIVNSLYCATNRGSEGVPIRRINVRGPSIECFFKNYIRRLCEFPEIKIMPQIITDSTYGIQAQDSINLLVPFQKQQLQRLPSMLSGIRSRMTVGNNEKLVKEVAASYPHRYWKLLNLYVAEGGMIPGRMEWAVFGFLSMQGKGMIHVEDTKYYV